MSKRSNLLLVLLTVSSLLALVAAATGPRQADAAADGSPPIVITCAVDVTNPSTPSAQALAGALRVAHARGDRWRLDVLTARGLSGKDARCMEEAFARLREHAALRVWTEPLTAGKAVARLQVSDAHASPPQPGDPSAAQTIVTFFVVQSADGNHRLVPCPESCRPASTSS